MKKLAELLSLLLAFSQTACLSNSEYHVAFEIAKAQMDTRPDSSLVILQNINRHQLSRESEQAYYALLYSQALDKNWIDLASDSIIAPAVSYYSRRGNAKERAYTNYYLGCIRINAGEINQAIQALIKAETYAVVSTDTYLLARIYNCLGILYLSQHSFDEAQTMFRRAEVYYRAERDSLNIGYALQNIAITYSLMKNPNLANASYRKALTIFAELGDQEQVSLIMRCIVTEMQEAANFRTDSMKMLLNEAYDQAHSKEIPIADYSLWAGIYIHENKIDSARYYGQLALADLSLGAHKKCGAILHMCQIEKLAGNYRQATHLWQEYHNIYDSIIDIEREQLVQYADRKYRNQELTYTNKLLQQRNRFINIGWGVILMFIIVTFIIIIYRKIQRYRQYIAILNENYENFKIEYARLSQELNDNSVEESNLLNAFENLMLRFYHLLDKAYKITGTKNFIKEFKNYTMSISHDKDIFANIQYVVNKRYYGLVDHLRNTHPSLTNYEIDMLCMFQCGFSFDSIRLLHQHESIYSIYSLRTKIHKKLGLHPHYKIETYLKELVEKLKPYAIRKQASDVSC